MGNLFSKKNIRIIIKDILIALFCSLAIASIFYFKENQETIIQNPRFDFDKETNAIRKKQKVLYYLDFSLSIKNRTQLVSYEEIDKINREKLDNDRCQFRHDQTSSLNLYPFLIQDLFIDSEFSTSIFAEKIISYKNRADQRYMTNKEFVQLKEEMDKEINSDANRFSDYRCVFDDIIKETRQYDSDSSLIPLCDVYIIGDLIQDTKDEKKFYYKSEEGKNEIATLKDKLLLLANRNINIYFFKIGQESLKNDDFKYYDITNFLSSIKTYKFKIININSMTFSKLKDSINDEIIPNNKFLFQIKNGVFENSIINLPKGRYIIEFKNCENISTLKFKINNDCEKNFLKNQKYEIHLNDQINRILIKGAYHNSTDNEKNDLFILQRKNSYPLSVKTSITMIKDRKEKRAFLIEMISSFPIFLILYFIWDKFPHVYFQKIGILGSINYSDHPCILD